MLEPKSTSDKNTPSPATTCTVNDTVSWRESHLPQVLEHTEIVSTREVNDGGARENYEQVDDGEDETDGELSLLNFAQEIYEQFKESGNMDDLNMAVELIREGITELPEGSDNYVSAVNNLANVLLTRFEGGGQEGDLDEAISLHRQGLELRDLPHPDRSSSLNNLANALSTRFEHGGQQGDLDEAISLHREALELCAPPHPNRPGFLNSLASALLARFEGGGQRGDRDEAISLYRQALEHCAPTHPNRSSFLSILASILLDRFEGEGQRDDLDEAISLHRQALELHALPHSLRSRSLNNLANALSTRFDQRGQRGDLDEAISLHSQALELRAPPHPNRSGSLNNLANVLFTRFEQGGQQGDLDVAISLHRQSLELRAPPHPDRSSSLNNLASALSARFEQGGQQGDLDEAIELHEQALELCTSPHPNRADFLNNLASALSIRFRQGGQQVDLDEAISLHRQALELRALPHIDRSSSLDNLASVLSTRFEQGGQQGDLDEAILLHRQSLELRDPSHPLRSRSLNNLASALLTRFRQGAQQGDINEAISLHRQALELHALPHPNRSGSLNNLSNALSTRFDQGGQRGDLDEAIELHRQALELFAPPHPDRSGSLNNLANVLSKRFRQGGQRDDLDEAISLHRQSLELRAPPHPLRHNSLNNLANALSTRFQQGGQRDDLDEAISLHKQALELVPPPHPDRSSTLFNLANLLMSGHSPTSSDSSYLSHAMSSFSAATQCLSASPSLRFHIAQRWAYCADLYQHPSAIEAYDAALQILPQLVAFGLDIQSRHEALTAGSDGLARRAARCAIKEGQLCKAVEYLETGRAVFWSQLLHLRSPVDKIHTLAPELADRLRNISAALERGSYRDTFAETLDNRKKMTLEEEASTLARLDREWSKAIDEVRGLDGFEDFLRPSRLSLLQAAAAKCPVILLISNDNGSHCLIMTFKSVHCIALPSLPTANLRDLIYLIQAAASQSQIWRTSIEEVSQNRNPFPPAIKETVRNWASLEGKRGMRYEGQIPSDDIFRSVLKTIWNEVVKPVVDFLSLQKSDNPPMLQWCPTGLFSFLPIHAAGCYDDELAIECASDYIISSYTPTIGALLTHNLTSSTEPFKMMIVVQSQDLPSTKTELAKIEQYVPKSSLMKLGIPGTTASVEAVASHLSNVSIAHFACHGKQDRSNPLNSGLKLEDGMLLVSRIMKEPMPNGSLAFLSACETAMGDGNLPDEAMSLAASLLFSGFRHVIATMWEMRDEDGPTIADNFYEEIFLGPDGKVTQQPDTGKSAQALHIAVKKLRSKNVPFRGWVPFIHIGK